MAEELRGDVESFPPVHRLIQETYRPFDETEDLVRCFGEAALAVTDSPGAEIAVQCPVEATDLRIRLGAAHSPPSSQSARFPIRYQAADLGCMAVQSPAPVLGDDGSQTCQWVAKNLAYHLKRHEVRHLARERHGREAALIGTSRPLGQVDRFIERASRTSLPALILGSAGSEVDRVALALHLLGPGREGPFLQVNCAVFEGGTFERQMLDLLRRADGGTLLLTHLEDLEPRSQRLLCEVLEVGSTPWAAERESEPVEVRLLATATRDLDEMVRRGELCGALLDALDFLRVELAPLSQRREDIPPLFEYYLRRYACAGVPEVSREVLEACREYDWPGDVSELARVAARLAVMTEDGRVETRHLRTYAPQILEEPDHPSAAPKGLERERTTKEEVLEGGAARLASCHPALQRAVEYIHANYQKKLSLAEVAANAYVSSSHLAHLFQQQLGTSFTRFLADLRVERSKRLLLERPWESVTTIAAEAGFSDLRHFERTFKGEVGCTPKQFRRISRAGLRLQK
jgi:DNA-binding NtrC family response regulator